MKRVKSKVLANLRCADDAFILRLDVQNSAHSAMPGQFLMLHIPNGRTFLRRPFSIADSEGGEITLLIREVGEGTRSLRALKENTPLDIIFPLGRGFSIPHADKVLLVAGGIGVSPLIFLIKFLRARGISTTLVFGADTARHLYLSDHLERLCNRTVFVTEDASSTGRGTAVDAAAKLLEQGERFDFLYTCGPTPMLRAVSELAKKFHLEGEASLESRMLCGIGVCLACSFKIENGRRLKICSEGPVLPLSAL
ncbi:MAG: dihydroorotate dehydrogenase electron transfer subunit [Planctomycetota bacterium]|nr:dihydroorotate dehydrogenase electron transfer subunit [Planctomycetota bacterium]